MLVAQAMRARFNGLFEGQAARDENQSARVNSRSGSQLSKVVVSPAVGCTIDRHRARVSKSGRHRTELERAGDPQRHLRILGGTSAKLTERVVPPTHNFLIYSNAACVCLRLDAGDFRITAACRYRLKLVLATNSCRSGATRNDNESHWAGFGTRGAELATRVRTPAEASPERAIAHVCARPADIA